MSLTEQITLLKQESTLLAVWQKYKYEPLQIKLHPNMTQTKGNPSSDVNDYGDLSKLTCTHFVFLFFFGFIVSWFIE